MSKVGEGGAAVDQPGEQGSQAPRHVAAGGWRRALVGLAVGLVAGAAIALVLPRDDGPRRRDLTGPRGTTPDR